MDNLKDLPPTHAKGFFGEQSMGFFLGEWGYFFVEGPSGTAGHGITAIGFDGVAFNPKTRHLIIYDNKAFAGAGNIVKATAVEPARNLVKNLDRLVWRVQTMKDMPNQIEILGLLRRTKSAVRAGNTAPANVDIAISNAGGHSRGIGARLVKSRIKFIDVHQAPSPVRRTLSNHDVAAFLGLALGELLLWLGEVGIEREIDRRLKKDLAPQIRDILLHGEGVLIVIVLQEWEQADFNNIRARDLLAVYLERGRTRESARENWESTPKLLQGPARGWRTVTRYGWIPPLTR